MCMPLNNKKYTILLLFVLLLIKTLTRDKGSIRSKLIYILSHICLKTFTDISEHLRDSQGSVEFKPLASRRDSTSFGNWRIRSTSKYKFGFDPFYANGVTKKTMSEQQQVQLLFRDHVFMFKVGKIHPVRVRSSRLLFWNFWISRPLVFSVPIGCLSRRVTARLYFTASRTVGANIRQHSVLEKSSSNWLP